VILQDNMKPLYHFIVACIGSGIVYWSSHNILYVFVFFIPAFLIDADHLLDYYLKFKKWEFPKIDILLNHLYDDYNGKVWVIFHSYELILIVTGFLFILLGKVFAIVFLLGFFSHIIFDIYAYDHKNKWLIYSLIYRWKHNFRIRSFYNKK